MHDVDVFVKKKKNMKFDKFTYVVTLGQQRFLTADDQANRFYDSSPSSRAMSLWKRTQKHLLWIRMRTVHVQNWLTQTLDVAIGPRYDRARLSVIWWMNVKVFRGSCRQLICFLLRFSDRDQKNQRETNKPFIHN